ncbi:MAG: MFS transporter, partial [Terriglobales bacterium]
MAMAWRPGARKAGAPRKAAGVLLAATTPGPSQMWAVGLTGFCSFLDVYVTQPILPELAHRFAASPAAVGLTISAVTLAVAIAAPVVGILADRIGRKRLIVAALLLLAIPTWLAADAPTLATLVHWRFAQGLLVPGVFVVSIAYVTEEWADRRAAALAMAVYVVGTVLGGVSGRFLTAVIAADWGWRTAFETLAGLTVIGGLAVWRLLPPAQR